MEHTKDQNRVIPNLIEYRVSVVDQVADRRAYAVQNSSRLRKPDERIKRRRKALAVEFRLFPSEVLKPVEIKGDKVVFGT